MAKQNAAAKTLNTNKWDTHTMVTMALLAALAALLSFLEFVIFPPAPFLKYDASFVPAMIGGFVFGPAQGFVVGLISCVIHALVSGNWWGALMNIVCVAFYVIPASLVYHEMGKTVLSAILGLVLGAILAAAVMIPLNMLITPIYSPGITVEAVIEMIVPVLLPFNALKAAINSVISGLLLKPVESMLERV